MSQKMRVVINTKTFFWWGRFMVPGREAIYVFKPQLWKSKAHRFVLMQNT